LKNNVCNNQQQMSAASRLSICNIEINGCNIEHQRAYPLDTTHNMSATSGIKRLCWGSTSAMLKNLDLLLQHPHETLATSL
jgi:hypothetical protein